MAFRWCIYEIMQLMRHVTCQEKLHLKIIFFTLCCLAIEQLWKINISKTFKIYQTALI